MVSIQNDVLGDSTSLDESLGESFDENLENRGDVVDKSIESMFLLILHHSSTVVRYRSRYSTICSQR